MLYVNLNIKDLANIYSENRIVRNHIVNFKFAFKLDSTRFISFVIFLRCFFNQIFLWFVYSAHFSSVRMCVNLPFFVLFLPAGRNLTRPGYEIFSQFFHDCPDVFSLPISRSVLQGERIRPSLNDFTTCYPEVLSLQRTYLHMDAYVTRILRPKQVWGSKATRIGGYKGEMYLVLREI